MKVRKHDLTDMMKFNPKVLEFHFSDSDLALTVEGKFNQRLIVHCYEYYEKKLLDIVSLGETNQLHSQEKSIELVQKAIDKTVSLNKQFEGIPTLVLHPGGYSLNNLDSVQIQKMKNNLIDAVELIDDKKVNLLLENMPPYAWFFGGRWNSNVFLDATEILHYCNETGRQVCFDLCHSQLYCNKEKKDLVDELLKLQGHVDHYHLADASGTEEEGLQFGEGDLPFEKIIPILNKYDDKSFSIEVWRGHEMAGKGFKLFLDKMIENGLIVR